MGTVIQFVSRQELESSRNPSRKPRPSKQAPLAHLDDNTLLMAYDALMAGDYATPDEAKMQAALEIEMSGRGIIPQDAFPAPRC